MALSVDEESVHNIINTIFKAFVALLFGSGARTWRVWRTASAFQINLLAQFIRVSRKKYQKI